MLADLGLGGVFPILQMGLSYPADVRLVAEFATHCKRMVVIEERRSFLEKNIRDGLFQTLPHEQAADLVGRLFGKKFPTAANVCSPSGGLADPESRTGPDQNLCDGIPDTRGLNVSVLSQKLIRSSRPPKRSPPSCNGRLTAELGGSERRASPSSRSSTTR